MGPCSLLRHARHLAAEYRDKVFYVFRTFSGMMFSDCCILLIFCSLQVKRKLNMDALNDEDYREEVFKTPRSKVGRSPGHQMAIQSPSSESPYRKSGTSVSLMLLLFLKFESALLKCLPRSINIHCISVCAVSFIIIHL